MNYDNLYLKRSNTLANVLVGIIVGVSTQYIADFLVKLWNKEKLKDAVKVTSTWQDYYTVVIAGGINGALLDIVPNDLYPIAAVLVITITYQTISKLSGLDVLSDEELIAGIVRDVFLVIIILKIINHFTGDNQDDSIGNSTHRLITTSISVSVALEVGMTISRDYLDKLFNLNADDSISIPVE